MLFTVVSPHHPDLSIKMPTDPLYVLNRHLGWVVKIMRKITAITNNATMVASQPDPGS